MSLARSGVITLAMVSPRVGPFIDVRSVALRSFAGQAADVLLPGLDFARIVAVG